MNFNFLDYVWRGLTAGTLTSLVVLIVLFLTVFIINGRATRLQIKNFFNAQILLLTAVFTGSFLWVACVDPELANGCFSLFAKDKSFFTLTRLFAALWVAGFAGLAGFDLYRIFKPLPIELKVVRDGRLETLLARLQRKLKIQRSVQLLTSPACVSPFAIGIINLKIVLPTRLLILDDKNLEHILAHELVHLRDQDSVWKALELLARRILFFNPVAYVVAKKHLLAIEKAADEEAVLATGASARDYIETLIDVVSLNRVVDQNPLALNASRTFKETKERMQALMTPKASPPKSYVNAVILVSVMASLGISVAQARSAVGESFERSVDKGLMCTQVQHEKVIEAWLQIQAPANKCEE